MDGSEAANRENIDYHYNLSNKYYELFLGPEMVVFRTLASKRKRGASGVPLSRAELYR